MKDQAELITEILSNNENMKVVGKSPQSWYQMQNQHRAGKLSDKTEREVLAAMGYEVAIDRKWRKSIAV